MAGEVAMDKQYAIGIDVGGTRTKVGLVELGGGTVLESVAQRCLPVMQDKRNKRRGEKRGRNRGWGTSYSYTCA